MDIGSVLNMLPLLAVIIPIAVGVIVIAALAFVVVTLKKKTSASGIANFGQLAPPGTFDQLSRAMAAGNPYPHQTEVEQNGWMAEARILDINDLETVAKNNVMVYHRAAMVLEVYLPNTAPYRVPCEQWIIGSKWMHVSQGMLHPVRIHPQNAQIVFLDFAAVDQQKANAESAEREAHARRQAELLGQNRH